MKLAASSSVVRTFAVLLACCCLSPVLRAGAIAEKIGPDAASIAKKVDLSLMSFGGGDPSGRGPKPYLPALGAPPKRVALVSFYVWDTGNEKKSSLYNRTVSWSITKSVTGRGAERIVNALLDAGLPALKEGFAAHGMTLLAPAEFLDTPEKKHAYEVFQLEIGTQGNVMSFLRKEGEIVPQEAAGYRLFKLATNRDVKGRQYELAAKGGDGKLFQGLGHDLADALGVDAVLIIYNVLQAETKSIDLHGSYAYLFGPNPVKAEAKSLYWTGHQYAGVRLRCDVPLMTADKQGTELSNCYAEYALIAKALAIKTGEYLQEKTKG